MHSILQVSQFCSCLAEVVSVCLWGRNCLEGCQGKGGYATCSAWVHLCLIGPCQAMLALHPRGAGIHLWSSKDMCCEILDAEKWQQAFYWQFWGGSKNQSRRTRASSWSLSLSLPEYNNTVLSICDHSILVGSNLSLPVIFYSIVEQMLEFTTSIWD